jgi:hypothetical protein
MYATQVLRVADSWMSHTVRPGALLLAALALAGCAALDCRPATVVVAKKEERTRIDDSVRAVRTDEVGRLQDVRRFAVVPDYWIIAEDGSSYRVPPDQLVAAQVGQSLQVCR